MVRIHTEKNFNEFEDFVALITKWFVYEGDELTHIHSKTRFICFDGTANFVDYCSYDCRSKSHTGRARKREAK